MTDSNTAAVPKEKLVLVTGGTGFVGAYCVLQLLQAGYRVCTTIRTKAREADALAMLKSGGLEPGAKLSFVVADLTSDAGWPEAVAGCDYVLHVASPFPPGLPKHEDELIIPAREGALRVLRESRDAGVKRVVLTSSFAAIGYGKRNRDNPFTEKDWTNPDDPTVSIYAKSKTLAEKAAWDFIAKEGGGLELSVINPTGILGPVLGHDYSSSIQLVQQLITGAMRGCPQLYFGIVDVRDVADLHILAMTNVAAKGERFIALADNFKSIHEMALILKSRMGDAAGRVPTRVLPNWMVRLVALFNPSIAQIAPRLGVISNASNAKATQMLGWKPRPSEEAIVATAESLVKHGLHGNAKKE